MCFSPQRRAILQHLNFKKCSDPDVFCTFSLENVLLATAACNFSTSQLQKVVRSWRVLYIFTSKCASRHSGVQSLISPLTTWLRTRRFNEPTFRLTRHTNHWKNTAFRDFSNIWRGCIFFLLTFAQLHLLSSDSTLSSDFTFFWLYFISSAFHLCFSTLHIVGSLLFKLPSIRYSGCFGVRSVGPVGDVLYTDEKSKILHQKQQTPVTRWCFALDNVEAKKSWSHGLFAALEFCKLSLCNMWFLQFCSLWIIYEQGPVDPSYLPCIGIVLGIIVPFVANLRMGKKWPKKKPKFFGD